MKKIWRLAWKRYPVWFSVLALEVALVFYLVSELEADAGVTVRPINYLQMGLFMNSYAMPAACMGVYVVLWLEDFLKRRVGLYLACGIKREILYYGKSVFGLTWIGFSVLILVGGLLLGGCYFCKEGISGIDFYKVLPILIVYLGIVVFLNALCTFCGVLLRRRTEGILLFGGILFFWNHWREPLGEDRIYNIVFLQDWESSWGLTGGLLVLSVVLYVVGALLVQRVDIR